MLRIASKALLPAVVGICCSACATADSLPIVASTNLSLVSSDALPYPTSGDYVSSKSPFIVGPYDILDIEVFGNDDLQLKDIQVDSSGRITFPLIGTVEVAGITPGQVARQIETMLRGQFIRNPQVTVNLKETASQVVSIGGEVKRPGVYPIIGEMTLLKAIARAEGWTEFSKKREVIVFRTVGGQKFGALYDVKSIEKGFYPDPKLFPNDTVVVGDSQARRNLKDIYTVAPPLLGPLIFLLGNNN